VARKSELYIAENNHTVFREQQNMVKIYPKIATFKYAILSYRTASRGRCRKFYWVYAQFVQARFINEILSSLV